MSVTLDETRCVGSGDCALVAPSAFQVDEDEGLARVLPGAAHIGRAQLERAARDCPTGAIQLSGDS
ncbi:MAG: ferredoxin [Nitriliruptorales bacterium]|nr:ferredoxin [Nitriliruptorales bacterium]